MSRDHFQEIPLFVVVPILAAFCLMAVPSGASTYEVDHRVTTGPI